MKTTMLVAAGATCLMVMSWNSLAIAQDKGLTPLEAYEMWRTNPSTVQILDCRTPEEYVFVGHPPMAVNIPLQLWTGKWEEKKQAYVLQDNPDFLVKTREKFRRGDTILVMCSSGGRSAKAVDKLRNAGFSNVHNIICRFANDRGKGAKASANSWEIMKNCWKSMDLPWSYALTPGQVYIP